MDFRELLNISTTLREFEQCMHDEGYEILCPSINTIELVNDEKTISIIASEKGISTNDKNIIKNLLFLNFCVRSKLIPVGHQYQYAIEISKIKNTESSSVPFLRRETDLLP